MHNIHFGAGNIGRGFIGLILAKNDFDVTFVDVNEPLLKALKESNHYIVEELSEQQKQTIVPFAGALNSITEQDEIIAGIKDATLITTSIGVSLLPRIAPIIAAAIEARVQTESYLNIIACENAVNATDVLKDAINPLLSAEAKVYADKWVGFPNAAVDRIVPNQEHEDITKVQVEPFFEWVVEQPAIKGTLELDGVLFVDALLPYIERKLFTVNTGHATCAYTAYQKGYATIYEAMQDTEVYDHVKHVLTETSELLIQKHGFDRTPQIEYLEKTLKRFLNANIIDETIRVARSPLRKLSFNDRLIKPLREIKEMGLSSEYLIKTIVSALRYDEVSDPEAVELQGKLADDVDAAIEEITGLHDSLLQTIILEYKK